MRDIHKRWPYPKYLKDWIFENTDYKTRFTTKRARFVSCIEIYDGVPVKRIFAYLSKTKKLRKKDMMVKEVARVLERKTYIGMVTNHYLSGVKYVFWDEPDHFDHYDVNWTFYEKNMTNYQDILDRYDLRYTGWEQYKGTLDFVDYLELYLKYPKIELLSKAGLGKWIKYLRYLDMSKKSLAEIFKIKPDCVPLLKDPYFDFTDLMNCRRTGYSNLSLLKSYEGLNRIKRDLQGRYRQEFIQNDQIMEILGRRKTLEYVNAQQYHLSRGYYRFYLDDYIDYLKALAILGGLNDPKAIYPEDFQTTHNTATLKIKEEKDGILDKQILEKFDKFKKYEYRKDGLFIVPVKESKELYQESAVLGHCVRNYAESVAVGLTEILFIRKENEPDLPYYTLELKGTRVIQVRGQKNKLPEQDVDQFVDSWAKKFRFTRQAMTY